MPGHPGSPHSMQPSPSTMETAVVCHSIDDYSWASANMEDFEDFPLPTAWLLKPSGDPCCDKTAVCLQQGCGAGAGAAGAGLFLPNRSRSHGIATAPALEPEPAPAPV